MDYRAGQATGHFPSEDELRIEDGLAHQRIPITIRQNGKPLTITREAYDKQVRKVRARNVRNIKKRLLKKAA